MRLFNILSIAATMASAALLIPQKANADRVCQQECVGPVCQERCVERESRRESWEGRETREERRDRRYEERDEGRGQGGVELRVPGGGIEIGR